MKDTTPELKLELHILRCLARKNVYTIMTPKNIKKTEDTSGKRTVSEIWTVVVKDSEFNMTEPTFRQFLKDMEHRSLIYNIMSKKKNKTYYGITQKGFLTIDIIELDLKEIKKKLKNAYNNLAVK
jgi:hypothetical protein